MKLNVLKREGKAKSENTTIRREGNIPAIVYSQGNAGETVTIDGADFATALRHMVKGHLPTTVFTLSDGKSERKALVKGIQYHPTTYDIIHLDFEELHDEVPVTVKVPIVAVGEEECPGLKLGGTIRMVIRHTRVRCLPKNLPSNFPIDVSEIGLKVSKRLSDIAMPDSVRPLDRLSEVALVCAKR